jgi:hypothetical protein
VPDARVDLLQGNAYFGRSVVEQAKVDMLGDARINGEVGTAAVERRPKRVG